MISPKLILARLMDFRIELECRRKKRLILKRADRVFNGPSSETLNLYRHLWKPLSRYPDSFYCDIYQRINGTESPRYIPENVYYNNVEPVLNNRAFSLAYADKSFVPKITDRPDMFPKCFLKGVSGALYDDRSNHVNGDVLPSSLLPCNRDFIIKPATDSAGGRGVQGLFVRADGVIEVGDESIPPESFRGFLVSKYKNNFILQEKVKQNEWFAEFNKSSVNTVRMMTYRSPFTEKPAYLGSVLRIGQPGSIVDNQASGGISAGITKEGDVQGFTVDKYGRRSELKVRDASVPLFRAMKEESIQLADRFPYHRVLGFDFCVDSMNRLRLLEINTKNLEINFIQMNSGPLFGEFTEEVIQYCSSNPGTYVMDWEC